MAKVDLTDSKILAIKAPTIGQVEISDSRGKSLRLRVSKGGTKTWIVRTRVAGTLKTITLGTFPDVGLWDARQKSVDVGRDAKQGQVNVPRIRQKIAEAMPAAELGKFLPGSFGAVAESYLTLRAENGHKRPEQTRWLLEHVAYPAWRDTPIAEIRRKQIYELLQPLAATKPALARRALDVIRPVFSYALDKEMIDGTPAHAIDLEVKLTPRDRALSDIELVAVWKAAETLGYPNGPFVKMLLLTGQRRGEVATMRWSALRDEKSETPYLLLASGDTKSARSHLVPLSRQAAKLLAQLPRIEGCDFVFTTSGRPEDEKVEGEEGPDKTPINGFSKLKKRIDSKLQALASAGAQPIPAWTFHDLRRTVATGLAGLGIDRLIVSKVLNHAERGVTGRVYDQHDYAEQKASALQSWADHIDLVTGAAPSTKIVPLRRYGKVVAGG